jgi:S1-C subfamily serine protease
MQTPPSFRRSLTALATVTVLLAGTAAPEVADARGPSQFADAARRAEPGVVLVEVTHKGGRVRRSNGVVVRGDGLVLCAANAVVDATRVRVRVADQWTDASVVARDRRVHVALLQLPGPWALPVMAVEREGSLRKDRWVVGVEQRLEGPRSVAGMVARAPEGNAGRSEPLALVDAPVVSGAALVNLAGELVGVSLGVIPGRRARAVEARALRGFVRDAVPRTPAP